jgi:amino-acid N-acetyltransferase
MTDSAASHAALTIRRATEADAPTIRQMVRVEGLDPTSLKWPNFLIAEVGGQITGIGQIKHYPGCEELGSLIVLEPYRGQGIAAALIKQLEAGAGRPLHLLCEWHMGSFYDRFGYRTIAWAAAPWVLKLKTLAALPALPFGIRVRIMRKD